MRTARLVVDHVIAVLSVPRKPLIIWEQAWDRDRPDFIDGVERIPAVENLLSILRPKVTTSFDGVYYDPELDLINTPPTYAFKTLLSGETPTQGYYHAIFHELAHWTGHRSRLDRLGRKVRSSMLRYAREELVAEVTAVVLMQHFELALADLSRHVAYFGSWLERAGDERTALSYARREAVRALNYVLRESGV